MRLLTKPWSSLQNEDPCQTSKRRQRQQIPPFDGTAPDTGDPLAARPRLDRLSTSSGQQRHLLRRFTQNPEKSLGTEMAKPTEQEHDTSGSVTVKPAEQDAANESLIKLINANVQPMREDQVQNAVKFLSHPKVKGSPVIYRRSFLEKKGLTREEIDEAFRRVPDPPSSSSSVDATANQNAIQHSSQASVQSQSPVMAANASPAPVPPVPTASTIQQYKFQWSHALLAIGILAASGAGTAVVFKNSVLPRLKNWILRVVKEKDDAENEEKPIPKPNPSEEVAEAAKQAASAAAIVAKTTQELLLAKSEDKKYFEVLKDLLDVQVEELKSMGNAIRKLENARDIRSHEHQIEEYNKHASGNGTTRSYPRIAYGEGSESVYSLASNMPKKVNGSLNKDSLVGRPSAPASAVESTGAPYSSSYMDIMAMIQRGETPPNIKVIDDMPPNPNQQPSNPRVAPRIKPWEIVEREQHIPPYANGRSSESSENLWDQKSVKIAEIEPEIDGRPSTYGIGSSEWHGRGWVPPQPPSVAIPEAAAAIRQPKPSAQKQQAGKDLSVAQYHLREVGAAGASGPSDELGSSVSDAAMLVNNEKLEESAADAIQV